MIRATRQLQRSIPPRPRRLRVHSRPPAPPLLPPPARHHPDPDLLLPAAGAPAPCRPLRNRQLPAGAGLKQKSARQERRKGREQHEVERIAVALEQSKPKTRCFCCRAVAAAVMVVAASVCPRAGRRRACGGVAARRRDLGDAAAAAAEVTMRATQCVQKPGEEPRWTACRRDQRRRRRRSVCCTSVAADVAAAR